MSKNAVRWIRVAAVIIAFASTALATIDAAGLWWFAEDAGQLWDKLAIFLSATGITISVAVLLAPFDPLDGGTLARAQVAAQWDTGNLSRRVYRKALQSIDSKEVGPGVRLLKADADPLVVQSAVTRDALAHGTTTVITTVDELAADQWRYDRVITRRLGLRDATTRALGVVDSVTVVLSYADESPRLDAAIAAWTEFHFDHPLSTLLILDAGMDQTVGAVFDRTLHHPGVVARAALSAAVAAAATTILAEAAIALGALAVGAHPRWTGAALLAAVAVLLGPPLLVFVVTCAVCATPLDTSRSPRSRWCVQRLWWPILPGFATGVAGWAFWDLATAVGIATSSTILLILFTDRHYRESLGFAWSDALSLLALAWLLPGNLGPVTAVAWVPTVAFLIVRARSISPRSAAYAAGAAFALVAAAGLELHSLPTLTHVQEYIAVASLGWLTTSARQCTTNDREARTWTVAFGGVIAALAVAQGSRVVIGVVGSYGASWQDVFHLSGPVTLFLAAAWTIRRTARQLDPTDLRMQLTFLLAMPVLLNAGFGDDVETAVTGTVSYTLLGAAMCANLRPLTAARTTSRVAVRFLLLVIVSLAASYLTVKTLISEDAYSRHLGDVTPTASLWYRAYDLDILVAIVLAVLIAGIFAVASRVEWFEEPLNTGTTFLVVCIGYVVVSKTTMAGPDFDGNGPSFLTSLPIYTASTVLAVTLLRPWVSQVDRFAPGAILLWIWVTLLVTSDLGPGNLLLLALLIVVGIGGPAVTLARRLAVPGAADVRTAARLGLGVFALGAYSDWVNTGVWLVTALCAGAIHAFIRPTGQVQLPVARRVADARGLTRLAIALASVISLLVLGLFLFLPKAEQAAADAFDSTPSHPIPTSYFVFSGLLALIPAGILLLSARSWVNARAHLLLAAEFRRPRVRLNKLRVAVSNRRTRAEQAAASSATDPAPESSRRTETLQSRSEPQAARQRNRGR